MFIEDIMYEILRPISVKYEEDMNKAKRMTTNELYCAIESQTEIFSNKEIEGQGTIIFPTPGCPHNVRDGKHCGCSFCDWNEDAIVNVAYVTELRKRNPVLYKEIQKKYMEKVFSRRKVCFLEEFAIQDCFSDYQITDEEMKALLLKDNNYMEKPIVGLVQVRADSVTDTKVKLWKRVVKKRMTLGVGVETGDEWIRNHWLNKKIYDSDIMNCISIAHQNNCNVCANILMELPGLNVKQNIICVMEAIDKLSEMGCDSIMLSPLVKKKYTIQQYLDNPLLSEDWHKFYYILLVLYKIANMEKRKKEKIMISLLNFKDYCSNIKDKECRNSFKRLLEPLYDIGAMKGFDNILRCYDSLCREDVFIQYMQMVNSLEGKEEIYNTLLFSAKVLQKKVAHDNDEYISKFHNEIESVMKNEI